MIDGQILENIYKESLEEDLILYIAKEQKISLKTAMDIYYQSRLSKKIHEGEFGIQYLDYRNLYEILLCTEPGLLRYKEAKQ